MQNRLTRDKLAKLIASTAVDDAITDDRVDELEARVEVLEQQLAGLTGGATNEQFASAAYESGAAKRPKKAANRPSPPDDGPDPTEFHDVEE